MDTVGLVVVGLVIVLISHWTWRWRNPKCTNGVLPPGSMGFPLIGETLSLIVPSYSLDLHPFIKKRIQRYGEVFKTNIVNCPVVVSADPEMNRYIMQREGKSVEMWYMGSFAKIFNLDGESRTQGAGVVHKYIRHIFLSHFGAESLREKLIPEIEQFVHKTLRSWSTRASIDVKRVASTMVMDFSAKKMISYNAETAPENLSDAYSKIIEGLVSFPFNIPGTAYHRCQKDQKRTLAMIKDILKERMTSPESRKGDFVDEVVKDMETKKYLSEEFVSMLIFGGLFATFESISVLMTLALKLLSDHPSVVEEMTVEHESVLKNKEDPNAPLTWDEYKSMTFTLQVINEVLRLGNVSPGIMRRALEDIHFNGMTIPKGWTIMMVTSALQLNPMTFENPLEFNPRRWKELDSDCISKNFMPFGGGTRQCAGAEYSRAFTAIFFNVLLTKYRWEKIKIGKVRRNPVLGFGEGVHIKISEKEK